MKKGHRSIRLLFALAHLRGESTKVASNRRRCEMYKPRHSSFWALVLLAGVLCWSGGSAWAQNPKANANANKPNPAKERRDAAMDELAVAVAARIQVDPQFKKYVEAVAEYDKNVKEFVKAHQGGKK